MICPIYRFQSCSAQNSKLISDEVHSRFSWGIGLRRFRIFHEAQTSDPICYSAWFRAEHVLYSLPAMCGLWSLALGVLANRPHCHEKVKNDPYFVQLFSKGEKRLTFDSFSLGKMKMINIWSVLSGQTEKWWSLRVLRWKSHENRFAKRNFNVSTDQSEGLSVDVNGASEEQTLCSSEGVHKCGATETIWNESIS
jgi:hypothetical protein